MIVKATPEKEQTTFASMEEMKRFQCEREDQLHRKFVRKKMVKRFAERPKHQSLPK